MGVRDLGIVATLLLAGLSLPAAALDFGETAPELGFKDIRYLPRTLADFGERKAIVIGLTAEDSDAAREFLKGLESLNDRYRAQGVEVAHMNSGTAMTIMEVAAQAIALDAAYTVLKDRDASAAQALGVEVPRTVVVLDGERALRYRGNLEGAEAALQAVIAGEAPESASTPVDAGSFPVREVPAPDAPVTFTKDVAPILYTHCAECHRPGEAAPFSLISYRQTAGRADMVAEVVAEERMPPWYGVHADGVFENDRRMTQAEKDTIAQWVAGGKLEGDAADLPDPPAKPETEWRIGEPDLILEAKESFTVPAEGYIPYEYVTLPYQFPEDTWVQGIEILPSAPETVHHANLAFSTDNEGYEERFNFLTGRVPGGAPVDLQGPIAMLLPKGAVLTLQIHYVTTGKEVTDRMRVGIRYAKYSPIIKRVHYKRIRPKDISIPPNDPFAQLQAERTIDINATVVALFSHMHLRGRDMSFFAEYPDGSEEQLLVVPNYSFDWQLAYLYPPGAKQFPKGTTVKTVSHYDNSAFNPYNPDPDKEVNYGDQTFHEMNDAYVFYLDNDEFLEVSVDPETGVALDKPLAQAK